MKVVSSSTPPYYALIIVYSLLCNCGLTILYQTCHGFTLVTFDVDGTLVRSTGEKAEAGAHSRAFSHAVGNVLGNNQEIMPVAKALPNNKFQGSTDGLILLRLARATLDIEPSESFPKLEEMMDVMYQYISELQDEDIASGISVLPGVIDVLSVLATRYRDSVACGLVTGNVEGIARRKMQAVGVTATNALAPPSKEQLERRTWPGADHLGFLGGFGSDYCSGNIDDDDRNHLDRAEQIAIAVRRCQSMMEDGGDGLLRVVHVGDAPADVLAAKAYSSVAPVGICVGMVGVATGSYSVEQLEELAGQTVSGRWEPVILEKGMADPNFLSACGIE
mmetsp:Transcript_11575/g.13625  ORF Transcript_11575/g.13625 Transcript_11575/m.13625 type:complete len:334 (+) Transcript_11575:43-1044(+)